MTRIRTTGLFGLLLLLASLATTPALRAQDTCDALIARASNEFDTARRLQLLVAAVDPATCPPRGSWTVGVQLLAQTLIEDRQDSVAAVWLRWGARLAPDMQPDTVQFLPRVVQAFRAARAFVGRTSVPGDTAAETTWLWQAAGSSPQRDGKLQVTSSSTSLRVEVAGHGAVAPGTSMSLAPASYALAASAPSSDSLRVTREVLPGVTTVIDFRLGQAPVAIVPPPPAQIMGGAPRKHGIPTWVKLAAAGGLAWAIAWNAYIKSH